MNIITVIKLRRTTWTCVADMRETRNVYKILTGKSKGKLSPGKSEI